MLIILTTIVTVPYIGKRLGHSNAALFSLILKQGAVLWDILT